MQSLTLFSSKRHQRAGRLALTLLATIGLLLAPSILLAGGNGNNGGGSNSVNKVEEDWELDVGTPNTDDSAPQLSFLISPTGDTSSYYAVFTVNQRLTLDDVGGLQLQIWNGETLLSSTTFSGTSSLATSGEKIQWTTSMSLSNSGTLTVEVTSTHGGSNAWGNFDLTTSASTNLSDLNGYDITGTLSSNNSGIDFGNTRVSKIVLQAIRTYTGTGNNTKSTSQLGTAKTVYQYP